ncbi:hypothetical protein OWM54_41940 [Myxococcus sp. MISCRS1]|uniref:hypothetical protein n=1 Tax=Myxococcus sp. MISCRS1 TaxID=2996786 RepID=UPI00226FB631|nr:hypothetical protein [Myxococcus sp. MISCRS1]MCY1003726.1 hypothetical protein [Myxococcus sp. MISCRS1]
MPELSDADLDMDAGLVEVPPKRCRCGRPVIYRLLSRATLKDAPMCLECKLEPTSCTCDPAPQPDAGPRGGEDAADEHGTAPTGAQEPSGDGPATWPPVPGTLPARLAYAARALAAVEVSLRLSVDDLQARAMLPLELAGIVELLAGAEAKAAFARSGLVRLALMVTASVRQGVL